MAAKKKAKKAKVKSRKRSVKRSAKDLSPRGAAKSVKGGLLPAVRPASYQNVAASKNVGNVNPGTLAAGDGSV